MACDLLPTTVSYDPQAKATMTLFDDMIVEPGSKADWDNGLSALHYKAHSLPVGAAYWKLTLHGQTIGVCVIGMSRPLLKERHEIFPRLKPGVDSQVSNIHRYREINDNFRVVGRFVIDTMFRSAGVAYRFLNLAARMHGFKFMEIQSSMSKFSRFSQRAGFQMVKPMRSPMYDKGLKFMRMWFESNPNDTEAVMEELEAMDEKTRAIVVGKMRDFYERHSSLEKTGGRRFYSSNALDGWQTRTFLTKIQGLCFSSPLYGVYKNPDWKRENFPKRLPLLAFDKQKTTEPLVILPEYGEL